MLVVKKTVHSFLKNALNPPKIGACANELYVYIKIRACFQTNRAISLWRRWKLNNLPRSQGPLLLVPHPQEKKGQRGR